MKTVFLDSNYLVAMLNPRDPLRELAKRVHDGLGQYNELTSEMVLAEVLNSLSPFGEKIRSLAVEFVNGLRKRNRASVIDQTHELFEAALRRYQSRPDQEWGFTDCASMVILEEHGVTDVLTADKHFKQAGFRALLLNG